MTAIDPFLTMMSFLKMTIAQVAPELLGLADIHEALTRLDAHASDLETLPGQLKKLRTGKVQAEVRLARSTDKTEEARRAVARINVQLGRLKENIDRRSTRRDHDEWLKQEITDLEATLIKPLALHKKAESYRKGDETRLKNLTRQLDVATRGSEACQLRIREMTKLAKKTADHLKHRQAHRDRKAAKRQVKAAKAIMAVSAPNPGSVEGRRR